MPSRLCELTFVVSLLSFGAFILGLLRMLPKHRGKTQLIKSKITILTVAMTTHFDC